MELSDPRFRDGWWQEQIQLMLDMGKKAEQQSLAKYGLDFVTDTYLPEKLLNSVCASQRAIEWEASAWRLWMRASPRPLRGRGG